MPTMGKRALANKKGKIKLLPLQLYRGGELAPAAYA
jgi:hypothetical protein